MLHDEIKCTCIFNIFILSLSSGLFAIILVIKLEKRHQLPNALLCILFIFALALVPKCSFAAECGGSITCNCSDTLIDSTVMNESLECEGAGIIIGAGNISLDCGSNIIRHSINSSGYGIDINGKENVNISNCIIEENGEDNSGSVGIRAISSSDITITDVSVSAGSSDAAGILLENTNSSTISFANITALGGIAFVINSSTENNFTGLVIDSPDEGSYAIYIDTYAGKSSSLNSFSNVTFKGSGKIHSRSDSASESCAEGNKIIDPSGFSEEEVTLGGEINDSSCNNILLAWHVRARASDISGKYIANAFVTMTSSLGNPQGMGTTGNDGLTGWVLANGTLFSPGTEIDYAPYSFTVLAYGFDTPGTPGDISSGTVNITLMDSLAPEIGNVSVESSSVSQNGSLRLSVNVSDNVAVSSAGFFIEAPDRSANMTAIKGGENEFFIICNYTNECSTSIPGQYNISSIWANDTTGNFLSSPASGANFNVTLPDIPEISGVESNETVIEISGSVTLSATITSQSGLSEVVFALSTPYGYINVTVSNTSSRFFVICNSTNECNTSIAGQYNLTGIRANDTMGNAAEWNGTSIGFTVQESDTLAPSITEIRHENVTTTSSCIFVATDEQAVCRYDSSDLDYDNMTGIFQETNSTSHSTSITGLSPSASYSFYVRCSDETGNRMNGSMVVSFTTSAPPSSGSSPSYGGGGSGGSSSAPAASPGRYRFSSMESGVAYRIAPGDKALAVNLISMQVKTRASGISIYVTNLLSMPDSVSQIPDAKVYQWFNISKDNLDNSNIASASIRFNVSKSWLSKSGLEWYDIDLWRYSGTWERLTATVTGESSNEYEFEAATPGFSVFAIAGAKPSSGQPGAQVCGNGVREGNEQCDGWDYGNYTCMSMGYDSGALGCKKDCTFDYEECFSSAGVVQSRGSPASGRLIATGSSDMDMWLALIVLLSVIGVIATAVYFYRNR